MMGLGKGNSLENMDFFGINSLDFWSVSREGTDFSRCLVGCDCHVLSFDITRDHLDLFIPGSSV